MKESIKTKYLNDLLGYTKKIQKLAALALKDLENYKFDKAKRLLREIRILNYQQFEKVGNTVIEQNLIELLIRLRDKATEALALSKNKIDIEKTRKVLADLVDLEKISSLVEANLQKKISYRRAYYFAGIDVGGSKSLCYLANSSGVKLDNEGKSHGFYTNQQMYRLFDAIIVSLKNAIINNGLKLEDTIIARLCVGFAGANQQHTATIHSAFISYIKRISTLKIMDVILHGDQLPAWYAAFGGNDGIVVGGGTGYFVYGKYHGRESILTDVTQYNAEKIWFTGSLLGARGAEIILKKIKQKKKSLLRAIVYSEFRTGKLFPNKFGKYSIESILRDATNMLKARKPDYVLRQEVAEITRLIIRAARNGDRDALELVNAAKNNGALYVSEVANKLGVSGEHFKVAFIGGLFASIFLLNKFRTALKKLEKNAEFDKPLNQPVIGCLTIAIHNIRFHEGY